MGRTATWAITYFCETASQIMRISFSFVQYHVGIFYNIDSTSLGIFLALSNIFMAICYFYRILFPFQNLVKGYFYQISLSAICLLIIPVTLFLNIHSLVLSIIAFSFFGWFQGSGYALLAGLMSQKFTVEDDGCLVGMWGSAGDMGNLLGLFLFTCIMYYLKIDWKFCMVVPTIFSLFMNTLLNSFLEDEFQDDQERLESNWLDKVHEIKEYFFNLEKCLVFLIAVSLAALQFGVLLWLPMYLEENGFQDFQGYITIAYGAFSMIGSSLTGKIYEIIESRKTHFFIQIWLAIFGLVPLMIIYLFKFSDAEKWELLCLIGMTGFCNGALFNMYSTNEILLMSEEEGLINTPFYMNIVIGGSYAWTGITQIFLGASKTNHPKAIFLLFVIMFFSTLVLIIGRLILKMHQVEKIEDDHDY